jgi:ring-1,2-phenylacetyl-CoA epoxidase subunit PaaC
MREEILLLADTCLILAQRQCEWTGHAPSLEEDIALANISLDLLGQARLLYGLVGDEDELAYWRNSEAYRNLSLAELENGDYAQTMLRLYLLSEYLLLRYAQVQADEQSSSPDFAAIAEKASKEVAYHQKHSRAWVLRLGDGTAESKARLAHALERLWPYTNELLSSLTETAAQELAAKWADTLSTATLATPRRSTFMSRGSKGEHTELLSYVLAQMQSVARAHPGAKW